MSGRFSLLAALAVLVSALSLNGQSVPLNTFHDPAHGVTFRYPAAWVSGVAFYLSSVIQYPRPEGGLKPPLAIVGFTVKDTPGPYQGTDLTGVQFVYNVVPDRDAAACARRVADVSNRGVTRTILNGIAYTHYSGADAGLGHGAQREVYSTFREGSCYLFEEAIMTEDVAGAGGQPRALTPAQHRELRRQLDSVMLSVRYAPAKTAQ